MIHQYKNENKANKALSIYFKMLLSSDDFLSRNLWSYFPLHHFNAYTSLESSFSSIRFIRLF